MSCYHAADALSLHRVLHAHALFHRVRASQRDAVMFAGDPTPVRPSACRLVSLKNALDSLWLWESQPTFL